MNRYRINQAFIDRKGVSIIELFKPVRVASAGLIHSLILGSLIATGSTMVSTPVAAQSSSILEEVVVTARKREENILDIPESLTTFTSTLIERANINGLEDIGLLVPNLYMGRRLDGFPNVSIRGLGGFGNTQGVGFYLDDVQLFSDASSRFGDMQRIEVLKGPQGILYGGANIGGAVKFVTARPDPEKFSGRVKLQAGEDNYYDGEIQLNIPLTEDWAIRLFGFAETDDSFLNNPNLVRQNGGATSNSSDVGKGEEYGIRASLAGDFSEQFSMYATIRYNDLDAANNVWSVESDGNLRHPDSITTSFNPRHKRETLAGSVEFTYEFSSITATSITSFTDTDSDRETDLDVHQEFVLDLFRPHRLEVFTQELRLTSSDDGPFQWQLGGYYLDYERDMDSQLLARGGFGFLDPTAGPVPPPLDASESALLVALPFENSLRKREQLAGFANFSYRWGDLEIGGGIRIDNWESERSNRDSGISGRQDKTEVLGRASLAWHLNDNTMVYGIFSQGFEPGDFNLTNFAGVNSLFGYDEEKATQFEIGYKGRPTDSVILTMAVFFINYDDRQFELQADDPSGGFVEGIVNAGDSKQWGFEADLLWELHENWSLSAGLGYVDAEWDSGTTSPVTTLDISGMTPPNTAEWSTSIALDYSKELNTDSRIFGRVQLRYKGDSSTNAQFFDAPGDDFPFWENPDFTVVDLGVGWEWNKWEFGLHVENIFDEEYYIDVQEFPNFAGSARAGGPGSIIIGTLEQPRRIVGSLQYRF